ncbi:MAG TPA: Stk1 family PASTA domain-containing Ser/Thr kinase [Bacillota bacterium]|jgi:serine/threonine-protein kinase
MSQSTRGEGAELIGRVLGRRYEILERVGGGGMAIVYKARDGILNRVVAVKVLRAQFADDEDFVRRFRHEAQAAASLSHQNIVSIYDVGEEDGTYFIVMEFVDGQTLKDRIREAGPLEAREVISVGMQIGQALSHAHQHRIVHRDIKPHNIMISRNGLVKVTDFGIARAATSNTLTATGTIVGSVHYFSPEQARGGLTDEKSDIYSLGIVLYEMLTAKVPFEGESPISVALKHVQEMVTPPTTVNPKVPQALERVVMKTLRKTQSERYQSVAEFLRDLQKVARGEAIPDLPPDLAPTLVVQGSLIPSGGVGRRAATRLGQTIRWAGVGLTVVLLFLALRVAADWFNVPTVIVPNLGGMTAADGQAALADVGLKLKIIGEEWNKNVPAGAISWQDPSTNDTVREGRTIQVRLSKGPTMVKVPGLAGRSVREAEVQLQGANLVLGQQSTDYADDVLEGYVIAQSPSPETEVREGSAVDITLSLGPQPAAFPLPDYSGENWLNVRKRMDQVKLVLDQLTTQTSEQPIGSVLRTVPVAGSPVRRGDKVSLVVSRGPYTTVHSFSLSFEVPTDGVDQQQIRIELTDALGTRAVYDRKHLAGDAVKVDINWVGTTGTLRTFADGTLLGTVPLK